MSADGRAGAHFAPRARGPLALSPRQAMNNHSVHSSWLFLPAPRVALALALSGCLGCTERAPSSAARLAEPIMGGSPVAEGAFPGVVWLDSGCTGVLVDEDTVLYAAHCGDGATEAWFGDKLNVQVDEANDTTRVVDADAHVHVAIEFCRLHPEPQLGQPSDIAFCRLKESAVGRELLPPPLLGCERAALGIDQPVTMVGYGRDPAAGTVGAKMLAETPLTWAITVLIAGDGEKGSCGGDSGGPLFVRTDRLNADWAPRWRLAGILSSGTAGQTCGSGRYVDVAGAMAWVEQESRRDLSPCGSADGTWNPSPRCRAAALDENGAPIETAPEFSDTCGAAFDASTTDHTAPSIDTVVLQDLGIQAGARHVNVLPTVSDVGWGVERVEVQFLDAAGELLEARATELEPYHLEDTALPAKTKTLRVIATDYAGEIATHDEPVRFGGLRAEASCAMSQSAGRRTKSGWLVLIVALSMGSALRAGSSRRTSKRSRRSLT